MPTLNTYLTFNGNCAEAFDFYKSVFGGEFQSISTFAEMPPDPKYPIPEADHDKIMHVSLPLGGNSVLMGSDSTESFGLATVGDNFSLSLDVDSKEEADQLFTQLSAGGAIEMPMNETFWGSYFGSFRDKFGVRWMISYDLPQS